MMFKDIELYPNKYNWASLVKHLLGRLGFLEVWIAWLVVLGDGAG